MGLNETVSAERPHISFFGMRNAGKSSVVNAVTGQELSVVSDIKGTTTDPVKKAMEILPLGPVVLIDTPGLDDEGKLGELRVKKAKQVLAKTDIAILVIDSIKGINKPDKELIALFQEKKLPYIIVYNKADLLTERKVLKENELYISAVTKENIKELKEKISSFAGGVRNEKPIVADLLKQGDLVLLVLPVDEAAPKGRLILPQQQTMRDILDARCSFIACQDTELKQTLAMLAKKPKLVITDSQVFEKVAEDIPEDMFLTSFSILFARYKGNLEELVKGAIMLSQLKSGDKILISEACTHHRQCNDIGTVKMPAWIQKFSGVNPEYDFTSGGEFPENLSEYKLIVHCGGCMLNEKEMRHRIEQAVVAGVPMVNYGVAIAQMNGILKRSLEVFHILKI
ncbi:MAG: [FeFe] hydrogenase H-cluster maturation GTPase HydF [Lachnospiraceae bacterium]|nr:[FeFe] hydrogenase H-cluster maturation GTPase HydF [Lachnospiraceae bacterium]MCI8825162.1 [FeFe] hydrogenase H-cluster maturation GTPase HydF [Lachnospiraceae bacterium]